MSADVGAYDTDDGRSFGTGHVSLAGVQIMLVRMESKFDALSRDVHYMREAQMTRAAENNQRFNDQEMRLRVIESKRYLEPRSFTAVAAIVLPVCAIAVAIIAIIVK